MKDEYVILRKSDVEELQKTAKVKLSTVTMGNTNKKEIFNSAVLWVVDWMTDHSIQETTENEEKIL